MRSRKTSGRVDGGRALADRAKEGDADDAAAAERLAFEQLARDLSTFLKSPKAPSHRSWPSSGHLGPPLFSNTGLPLRIPDLTYGACRSKS